jgi:hypothetical protein
VALCARDAGGGLNGCDFLLWLSVYFVSLCLFILQYAGLRSWRACWLDAAGREGGGGTYVALVDADGEAGLLNTLLRHVGGFDWRREVCRVERGRQ